MKLTRLFLLGVCLSATAGCYPKHWVYRDDIQQGNVFTMEQIDSLSLGMPAKAVAQALGEPVLRDPLHLDRWDYVSYVETGKGEVSRQAVTLFFEDGALSRIVKEA